MDSLEKKSEHHLEVEQKIIHVMLKSVAAVDEMLSAGFGPDFFDKDHAIIVENIYQEYVSSGQKRLLTRDAYRQRLVDANHSKDLMHLLTAFDKCFIKAFAKTDDLGYLKKQLVEGHIARNAQMFLNQWRADTKKHGYELATRTLVDSFQGVLISTEFRKTIFASLGELKDSFIERLEEMRKNPQASVRCGIPEIDNAINVGFRPKHLTLFVGAPGSHKTNIMLNIALNLCDRGHPVLFIPLEMDHFDLMSRIICNRSGIDSKKLAYPELLSNDELEKIKQSQVWLDGNGKGKFCLLESPDRMSVASLHREIEKRVVAFKPKAVVIDYADILKTDVRYSNRTIEIGEMIKALRHLGGKYEFSIISAAQMNRAAIKDLREGKEEAVDSTSIHGSQSYAADSDTVFGLARVPNEPNKIKLITIKARHGVAGGTSELHVDPARYLILSTSIITDNSDVELLEEDMNRPPEEISNSIQNAPTIEFNTCDLDEISSLG